MLKVVSGGKCEGPQVAFLFITRTMVKRGRLCRLDRETGIVTVCNRLTQYADRRRAERRRVDLCFSAGSRAPWMASRTHGRQSGLEPFKTAQQTGLHPTAPAIVAWQKFSQVIKTGICRPIGTHTRKRHLQTAFVHARLGRQLTCLRHLSFDLS